MPLTEWDEPLHVLPAAHMTDEKIERAGTYVLMKAASRMKETKQLLMKNGREAAAVLNCGMENELVCRSIEEIPDDAGYFTLLVSKGP